MKKIDLDYYLIHQRDYIDLKLSAKKIAEKYNVNAATILRGFKRHGLTVRNNHIDYSNIHFNAFDQWSNEMAYWLGFIVADGSIHSSRSALSVNLKIDDKNHMVKLS